MSELAIVLAILSLVASFGARDRPIEDSSAIVWANGLFIAAIVLGILGAIYD